MDRAELLRGDEFNPCMPILRAVFESDMGDGWVLALSLEMANVLLSVRRKDDPEAERLLGFMIAAVCKLGETGSKLSSVKACLDGIWFAQDLLEKVVEWDGPMGAVAKVYLDLLHDDGKRFSDLCARAALPLKPFAVHQELRRLSSVLVPTFWHEEEWADIRWRIEAVAPYMMPVFDWAAGKELRDHEAALAVGFWVERGDRLSVFLQGICAGVNRKLDLEAGRVFWLSFPDGRVVACGKALVLGFYDREKKVFGAAWADAGRGKVRGASRVDGVPDTGWCDDVAAYGLASRICSALGCDFLDVIEEDDVVTFVGLKDVHKPGWKALFGRGLKHCRLLRSAPAWAETALREQV